MDALWLDVRYACRQLRASPAFTAAAVLTLAIGIGTTTALFSLISAALLRPLPYTNAGDLIDLHTRITSGRLTNGLVSGIELSRLNDPSLSIARIVGMSSQPLDGTLIRDDGTPVHVIVNGVTEGFFDALGLPMARGRAFTHEEHLIAGQNAPIMIVLGYLARGEQFSAAIQTSSARPFGSRRRPSRRRSSAWRRRRRSANGHRLLVQFPT